MASDLLIVHKKIVPDYLEKVIETRELLARHEAASVTEAVQITGISRNTFYKYKNYVWRADEVANVQRAIISLVLKDEPGSLSEVLGSLFAANVSVITISQSIPVASKAAVTISMDISHITVKVEQLIGELRSMKNVMNVQLDAIGS